MKYYLLFGYSYYIYQEFGLTAFFTCWALLICLQLMALEYLWGKND